MSDRHERLAQRTLELCQVPSVTGEEAACAALVEGLLRRTPLEVSRVGQSIVARTAPTGKPLVLLVGHTDTVPPKPTDGPPRREGNRLYGVGASDMKCGLAVMLELAESLGPRCAYDLGLVFYDREEGPWVQSGLGPVLDTVPWIHGAALAFCLEPSDNVIQVGCLGTLHARVSYRGRAAHSARPWQGDNAIHQAAPLLMHLAGRDPVDVDVDGHRFREVLSATLAQGGRTRNVIPDHFELNLNYRFAPGRDIQSAIDEIQRLAGAAEVEVIEAAPSGRVVTQNPLLQAFIAMNGNKVAAKQAWTDVARLTAAGIDAVNLGPGLAAQAHQAGEFAEMALVVEGYRQFESFLTA